MPEYKAVGPPQTICSCDPRRSLLFRRIVGMELRHRRHGTHDPFADAAFSCRSIGDCTTGSDADDAARLQFGRIKFHARDRPYDQCSRRRGPEKGHGIWSAMIDFRCLCYRERLDEPKAAESTKFSRSPLLETRCLTPRIWEASMLVRI
jgi:hypothetical protein